ncbi:MAG: alkaline phosphatase D family protein [Bacteroidota bacterium]
MKFFISPAVSILFMYSFLFAQPAALRSGPMVGYGQMTEVMLWVQTTKPVAVQYLYWDTSGPNDKQKSISITTSEAEAYTARTVISGLQPGRSYGYELLIEGKPVKRNYPLRFQTQSNWQWRTDPSDFTAAFGSCAYVNEKGYDRPGREYGGDYKIFAAIASKQPDLFLWGGDNVYYRERDWDTRSGLIHRNEYTRALPEMQPLLGAAHNYAIWDDHDYGPNDADRSYRLRETSLEIFKLFWANQTYGTGETPGIFGRFIWNDVEFFLLDDRYHRSPNKSPNDSIKTMFGKAQLQWLKDALSNSAGNAFVSFRVIMNGNQMLNTNGEYNESLTQFSNEYNELILYIKQNSIPGIIFLSGDRHFTEMISLRDSSFYPLYEYTSSALTSGMNTLKDSNGNPTGEFYNPLRVEGTLVTDEHNFGMLKFSGKQKDRAVALECYDAAGALRWSKKIKASELKAK